MPEPTPQEESELFDFITKGDQCAKDFLSALYYAGQIADDIVDGDRDVKVMAELWETLLVRLVVNPFYLAHASQLRQVILNGVTDWVQATRWENEEEHKQHYSFIWRTTLDHVAVSTAYLKGGWEHAAEAREKIADLLYAGSAKETFKEYQDELVRRQ